MQVWIAWQKANSILETILSLRYSITGVFDNGGHDSDAAWRGQITRLSRGHIEIHFLTHPHPEQSL